MMSRFRQEVLNVILAQLLEERGVNISPESIITDSQSKRNMPDLLANFQGLRVAFEGEIDDQANAKEKAKSSARERVENSISHIGIAIIYPQVLRTVDFNQLEDSMENSIFEFAIISESRETEFLKGNVNRLADELNYSYEHLVNEDVVREAVQIIEKGIEEFSQTLIAQSGNMMRLAEVLGIRDFSSD